MKKEDLIAAGLTEAQATAVLAIHKKSIDGEYIPKATFDAERETGKTLKSQVDDRDKQIKDLGAFKGTAEQLQIKVDSLQKDNKEAKDKFDGDLLKAQMDAAIKFEIQSRVVDVDDVLPRLDANKIVFKDGKIESGLTEQLDTLQKAKPHYFKAEDNKDTKPSGWLFGTAPAASGEKGDASKDEGLLFGQNLAKLKTGSDAIAAKAAETYFK